MPLVGSSDGTARSTARQRTAVPNALATLTTACRQLPSSPAPPMRLMRASGRATNQLAALSSPVLPQPPTLLLHRPQHATNCRAQQLPPRASCARQGGELHSFLQCLRQSFPHANALAESRQPTTHVLPARRGAWSKQRGLAAASKKRRGGAYVTPPVGLARRHSS